MIFPHVLIVVLVYMHRSGAVFSYPKPARIAEHKEFPWKAVVLKNANISTYGATVVSRFYLVTLCKRVSVFTKQGKDEITYSNIRVVAGSISVRPYEYQGAQVRWIYYWEDHPKCRDGGDAGYKLYDISIIKVTQMFIFNSYLQPMPFERDQAKMKSIVDKWISSNKTCTFAAFGAYRYKNITITEFGVVVYDPAYPSRNYNYCMSKHLRAIEMRLVDYPECLEEQNYEMHYLQNFLPDPPVASFCALGVGFRGNSEDIYSIMNRTGMLCYLDFGSSMECKMDDGDKAGQYLVIGHASYGQRCTIRFSSMPAVFTRFDWELHEWIMQFYNPDPYGDHWVDAEYNNPIEYCNSSVYSGPIPPEDIS